MGMPYNNANCDIYIGKGAGNMLLKNIRGAQRSVKIVSPFLSARLVQELIALKNNGVKVELITMNNIEDYSGNNYRRNIYELIKQKKVVDEKAKASRDRWIKIADILIYSLATVLVAMILCVMAGYDWYINILEFPLCIISLAILILHVKIAYKRTNNYYYYTLFPFKVYKSSKKEPSIHSKIYLIDDNVAFLGSLNFTISGTENNHETRIKVKEADAVKKISDEFYHLFHNANWEEKDIQEWGRKLYKEAIN